ncbi:hypothetical protein AALD01_18645 [Oscillospiraceae bacterium 21-37]
MGELRVRRNRGFAPPRYEGTAKTEKQAGSASVRQAGTKPGVAVSDTLRQLAARISQSAGQVQQAKRGLLGGEAALAEVRDALSRMESLAQKAAGGTAEDSDALQAQLEELSKQVDRVIRSAVDAGFFQADAPLPGEGENAASLPGWLLGGMASAPPDKETLLAALGLDAAATGREVLEALSRLSLEDSSAAGCLASLYLGSVIAGGGSQEALDPALAAEGLQKLLEAIAKGASPDQAVESLTGGRFTSLADFQEQFTTGAAPGLQSFLTDLLLPAEGGAADPGIPPALLLPGGGSGDGLSLLLNLLASLEGLETDLPLGAGGDSLLTQPFPLPGEAGQPEAQSQSPAFQGESLEAAGVRAVGATLSGVSFDPQTGVLTAAGDMPLLLRGTGGQAPALRLAGPGMVVLRGASIPQLTVQTPQARLQSQGGGALGQVRLGAGTSLTLEGEGVVRIRSLQGGAGSALRLLGCAAAVQEESPEGQPVPVVLDSASFLLGARPMPVYTPQGEAVKPFDLLWKALVPGWSALTSLTVDGRQAPLSWTKGGRQEMARLWLPKPDPSHGYPAHSVLLQGRDEAGRLRTRYVYLLWSQRESAYQQAPLYPNPFTVTGGAADTDWRYEEESCTLRVLTSQVDAISGGAGTDLNQQPFSGRLALADGIGAVSLTLDGVECRVASGRAFSLGRGNQVTLLLPDGTHNIFESGPGCAGISLGDGTSLCIDRAKGGGGPPGALTATGSAGSAGIGRDSGVGKQQTASIMIRGGRVTAAGRGDAAKARPGGDAAPGAKPLPHPPLQALGLDALDISTREAAQAAVKALAAGKQRITHIQRAYSALYSQLDQAYGASQYQAVRDAGEAGSLLWDMQKSLLDAPLASMSQWDLDGLGQLLW